METDQPSTPDRLLFLCAPYCPIDESLNRGACGSLFRRLSIYRGAGFNASALPMFPDRWAVLVRGRPLPRRKGIHLANTVTPARRPFVIASIMLATFMAAIEGTIVATAMPNIVGQLGGFSYYSWVFSAYLLAQSTTTVIYGKLADLFGRKPVLIAGLVLFLREAVETHQARIDYLGALLFSISIGSLLILLTETDAATGTLVALACVFLATGALFLRHEQRTPEPIISIELWARRLVATSNIATLLAGMAMIALMTVLPIYVQGVLGRSPLVAGSTLTALVIGWPVAVMLSGRLFRAFGIRRTLRTGSILLPVGASFMLLLTPQSQPFVAAIGTFLMGFGMGVLSITTVALVQDSVEWSMRGSATASILFARSLGTTVGATAVGALLNMGIAHFGSGALAASVRKLLNEPSGLAKLSSHTSARFVFDHALRWSFSGIVATTVLTLVAAWLIPVGSRQTRETQNEVSASQATSH
jgi:MFS family permease